MVIDSNHRKAARLWAAFCSVARKQSAEPLHDSKWTNSV